MGKLRSSVIQRMHSEDFDRTGQMMCANYDNTPMQYTAILHGLKKGNFQMKKM